MKVVLVHDWLTGMRGGEKVLAELVRMFPSADVYTLFWRRGSVAAGIEARIRGTSFLDRMFHAAHAYRYYLPLFPLAVRSLRLPPCDLVLSSSHAVAKGARIPPGAVHVSYVHTPMRYVWDSADDYFRFGRGRRWRRVALSLIRPYLRWFDRRTAAGVDFFVANSENVRRRIQRIYGRDACVVPPPVDTDFFTPEGAPAGEFYLVVSSLEPYKRVDLAVRAFSGGSRRLIVAGKGTLERDLRRLAAPPVEFAGEVSDTKLRQLYRRSRALVFPGREDFGIVPVEAQACGRPVICYGEGGALETVLDGETGIHFRPQTAEALLDAVARLERHAWNPAAIRLHSLKFSRDQFRRRMIGVLEAALAPAGGSPGAVRAAGCAP
ncbi:MAG TPA: glycosyltransferase [Bryobacteraceae bacterium]|nr:glycosyltransferase [Bryobacteraceae bacterium]